MRICLSNSGDLDQAAYVHALIIIPGRSESDIVLGLSVHFIRPHFLLVQNHISVPIGQVITSWFITTVSSLIAQPWVRPQTL